MDPRLTGAAVLLLAVASSGCSPDPATLPGAVATVDRGAGLGEDLCAACHQGDGRGITHVYPSLAGSPVALGDAVPLVRWVVRGERPASMPAGRYSSAMPSFGWLGASDTAAVLSHVRSHFGNHSPALDAAAVARSLGPS